VCTVSALPEALLARRPPQPDPCVLRVVANRDELDTREAAHPPVVWTSGTRRVVMPVDPESGGTWIAVNDAGVVFAVLNASADGRTRNMSAPPRSRGTIIPALADSDSAEAAFRRTLILPVTDLRPFRLLLIDRHEFIECRPREGRLSHRRTPLLRAMMRTSSGLGDSLVQRPRRALFRAFFNGQADAAAAAQDAFHAHQWPGREAISVNMRRVGARTVSRATVEVWGHEIRLAYQATGSETVQIAIA
jgi:uncharacterized protein with NRDE domain